MSIARREGQARRFCRCQGDYRGSVVNLSSIACWADFAGRFRDCKFGVGLVGHQLIAHDEPIGGASKNNRAIERGTFEGLNQQPYAAARRLLKEFIDVHLNPPGAATRSRLWASAVCR